MEQEKIIISKIKDKRKQLNLTQKHIADVLDVDTRTYQNIESGATHITLDKFIKLCEAFEVEPNYFFNSTNGGVFNNYSEAKNWGHIQNLYENAELIAHLKDELEFYRNLLKQHAKPNN